MRQHFEPDAEDREEEGDSSGEEPEVVEMETETDMHKESRKIPATTPPSPKGKRESKGKQRKATKTGNTQEGAETLPPETIDPPSQEPKEPKPQKGRD